MPGNQTNFLRGTVSVSNPTNQRVTNLNITSTGTEFNHAFQSGCKHVIIRHRGNAKVQTAFNSGETNTKYFTIPARTVFSQEEINLTGKTWYFEADAVGILEIVEFY